MRKELKYRVEEDIDVARAVVEGETDSELISALGQLTTTERACLYSILESADDEEYNEKLIAERAGVNPVSLWRARRNPKFQYALNLALMSNVKGEIELGIRALRKKVRDGNMQAIKLWLELTGVWQPIQRVHAVNVNLDRREIGKMMPDEAKEEVAKQWKNLGWSKEEFMKFWDIAP